MKRKTKVIVCLLSVALLVSAMLIPTFALSSPVTRYRECWESLERVDYYLDGSYNGSVLFNGYIPLDNALPFDDDIVYTDSNGHYYELFNMLRKEDNVFWTYSHRYEDTYSIDDVRLRFKAFNGIYDIEGGVITPITDTYYLLGETLPDEDILTTWLAYSYILGYYVYGENNTVVLESIEVEGVVNCMDLRRNTPIANTTDAYSVSDALNASINAELAKLPRINNSRYVPYFIDECSVELYDYSYEYAFDAIVTCPITLDNTTVTPGILPGTMLGYTLGYEEGRAEVSGSYQDGYNAGYNVGYTEGNEDGYQDGYYDGIDSVGGGNWQSGYDSGFALGYDKGEQDGINIGYQEGYGVGYDVGYGEGETHGADWGYAAGYEIGFESGDEHGYWVGYDEGYKFGAEGYNNVGEFIVGTIGSFLDMPLFGSITMGGIMLIAISIPLVVIFLKKFAGG